jgi:hypothetical protein
LAGGTSLRTSVRNAVGSCSPAAAERVYDRSKPLGPSTRKSQLSAARDPAIDTHHSPCRLLNARSRHAVISRHRWASPRFCNSIVTAIRRQSVQDVLPTRGAKRSTPRRTGLLIHHKQPYPQFMLKIEQIEEGTLRALPSSELDRSGGCDRVAGEIGKAATLVMLQPPAPAREPTAWMHAPSQPLMRSLLSQFQTPTAPRKSQSVFSGLVAHPVALQSGSPSLLRIGNFLFSPTLSAIDGCHPKPLVMGCQCPFSVQTLSFKRVRAIKASHWIVKG